MCWSINRREVWLLLEDLKSNPDSHFSNLYIVYKTLAYGLYKPYMYVHTNLSTSLRSRKLKFGDVIGGPLNWFRKTWHPEFHPEGVEKGKLSLHD